MSANHCSVYVCVTRANLTTFCLLLFIYLFEHEIIGEVTNFSFLHVETYDFRMS